MKINNKILSLPPYISTAWKNVVSLQVESHQGLWGLTVELSSGNRIFIPNLDRPSIDRIFACHASYLEEQEAALQRPSTFALPLPMNLPGIESLTGMLQHNPAQAETPPLPAELLEKVSSLAKSMGVEEGALLPKAEPHCNCPHCQVMRAVSGEAIEEEVVSDDDLKFRSWDIEQSADKLYTVTNPLDEKEHYNVFLGEPVGCTCGNKNCEHIQAVLKS